MIMTPDEIKLRINTYADDLITKIFSSSDDMFAKVKIATAKYWVKQNIWKLTPILNNFVDQNGEIEINETIDFFVSEIFDENGQYTINLQSILNNPQINQFIPDKTVLFTRQDFNKMFGIPDNLIIPKPIEENNEITDTSEHNEE